MESIAEQVEYGRHCMHGTPIGTFGGADLLCGPCEDGADLEVTGHRWELYFARVTDDGGTLRLDGQAVPLRHPAYTLERATAEAMRATDFPVAMGQDLRKYWPLIGWKRTEYTYWVTLEETQ